MEWTRVAAYGTVLVLSAVAALNVVVAALTHAALGENPPQDVFLAVGGTYLLLATVPAFLMTGFWIGRRARSRPVLAALGVAVVARSVMTFTDMLANRFRPDPLRLPIDHLHFYEMLLGPLLFLALFMPGLWWGVRTAKEAYIAFLMRKLPSADTDVYLQMAYEDALRLTRNSTSESVRR